MHAREDATVSKSAGGPTITICNGMKRNGRMTESKGEK